MSACETLVHEQTMFLQLCPWMLLLLSAWAPTGHAKYRSPPEVVIPLRVTDPTRYDISPDWLSYSLRFGGERHIITMKPTKSFISRNFLLLTYSDQGDLIEEQPFVQNDCYYHGDVDGDPESMVILNTCLGTLQGTLMIYGTLYEIMPKNLTSTYEHLIYKTDFEDSESFSMRCGLTEEEIARQRKIQEIKDSTLMQSHYENWWTHHYYVEYFMVVENKHYVHRKRNDSKCLRDMVETNFGINALYVQIDVEVIILAMEIWTQTNYVDISTELLTVARNFCNWKRIRTNIQPDIAHLFARQRYPRNYGLGFIQGFCSSFNCAVNSFLTESIKDVAFIAAHEMGHNLGMNHDDGPFCTCGLKSCLMAAGKSNVPRFSNCSYNELISLMSRKSCQHNIAKLNLNVSICGNYLIEEGEQCDCGSSESCEKDPCCEPDCVLKHHAQCSVGLCCKSCRFRTKGTLCREKKSECDLPEWCNGTSGDCPENVYVQNGSPCGVGGYCYNTICSNREEHCQRLFGKSAKSADKTCYMEMNRRGDRFGNCGNNSKTYTICGDDDVLCGRIQCVNVEEIPMRRNHETVHWTHFNNTTCWSIDYHFGIILEDSGAVTDGTSCGLNHICLNRTCVPMPLYYNCSYLKCNMKGVCNNKQNCHCYDQWQPPDCELRGTGGSIDSGPAPRKSSRFNFLGKLSMILLLIALLVLLLVLIIIIIKKKLHGKPKPTTGKR